MHDILQIISTLKSAAQDADGKSPLRELGIISCAQAVRILHVPFYEPCAILVVSGSKTIVDHGTAVQCRAGELLTVPAPSSFDLRNEPDQRHRRYQALIIPFQHEQLERVRQIHDLHLHDHEREARVLHFKASPVLHAAIGHYLHSATDRRLRAHRLMEILLILAGENPALIGYLFNQKSWSQRVRAVLATDLTLNWEIETLCARLATSESTLRRHLRREHTGFRELLAELRLSTALMQLLQTSRPIYQIAYDCGFQSVSRFSSNFHKRFGLPPRELRESAASMAQRPNRSAPMS